MRELIGKIPTKDPNVTEVVYLAEMVRCLDCEQTVPVGIEVVTVKKNGKSKKAVRHVCYCRGHGFDYEAKARSAYSAPSSIGNVVPFQQSNLGHDLTSLKTSYPGKWRATAPADGGSPAACEPV